MSDDLRKPLKYCLIFCIAILCAFTLIKLVFPNAVIELATTPSLLALSAVIDQHWIVGAIIAAIFGYIVHFLFLCAACRMYYLNRIENIIVIGLTILEIVLQYAGLYTLYNLVVDLSLLGLPLLFTMLRRTISVKHFYSTIISYAAHNCSQALSLNIRGLADRLLYPNLISTMVLLIDTYIVLVILYLYYARKEIK